MADQTQPEPRTEPVAQPNDDRPESPTEPPLEEEDQQEDDDFHEVDGPSTADSQASLRSSILDYRRENGRTYHSLSDGKYMVPNDELEQERLDIVNHLWTLIWDGKFCMCPKDEGKAKRVLDIGTGTGVWAMDFADAHPEARVVGVDLSPIQPAFVPVNCAFEVDDLEKRWTWIEPFDFIFARNMMGSFADWFSVIEQAYDHLEPGGYFEIQDFVYPLLCDDGSLKDDAPVSRWSRLMLEACDKLGRSVSSIAHELPGLLGEVGFEEITVTKFKAPLSDWPKDPKWREVGSWLQASMFPGLEGLSLALFTRVLGWTRDETLVFCVQVREDVRNRRLHGYYEGFSVYGRKPFPKRN